METKSRMDVLVKNLKTVVSTRFSSTLGGYHWGRDGRHEVASQQQTPGLTCASYLQQKRHLNYQPANLSQIPANKNKKTPPFTPPWDQGFSLVD
tara:strand:- start:151 stop:432 length:282 start_codon:yes stop_codon:yes gene_type:complete